MTEATAPDGRPVGPLPLVDPLPLVEQVARAMPGVPRLAILDAVESELERLRAPAEPWLLPLVAPAALWRLRHGFGRLAV